MEVDAAVGFARNGAAHDIADRKDPVAATLGFAQACQGVGGFSGLGDDKDEGVLLQRGISISELAGVFDVHRNVGKFLDQILGDESGVPTGPTGGYYDAVDFSREGQEPPVDRPHNRQCRPLIAF